MMYYYHATFRSNQESILKHGLQMHCKRNWNASCCELIYVADEPEEAAKWMVYWYEYQFYELLKLKWGFSNTFWSDHTTEELFNELPNVERMDEGVVVFEIDTTGFKVTPRYDEYAPETSYSRDRPLDYVIEGDIPPERLKLKWYVSPDEIKGRIILGWGLY